MGTGSDSESLVAKSSPLLSMLLFVLLSLNNNMLLVNGGQITRGGMHVMKSSLWQASKS